MKQDKIYYNTEYRKKIKALSKFNIFIKDRISKKDEIKEKKLKKKKNILVPLIYITVFNACDLVKKVYNRGIYKKKYDLKLDLVFIELKKNMNKENLYFFFKNQLIVELLLNSIIFFFLIINGLGMNEWNKGASLTDIIDYNFLNLNILIQYINNYFSDFMSYFTESYNELLIGYFFDLEFLEKKIIIYNFFLLNNLDIFYFLFNIEEIKLEHEKNFVLKKNGKNIRKFSFDYLNTNCLKNIYNISFFTYCIYEFNFFFNQYKFNYITFSFFEYWVDIIIEYNYKKFYSINSLNQKNKNFYFFDLKNLYIKIYKKKNFTIRVKYNLFLSNIDYFLFFQNILYNYYIRNNSYFFKFASQRKLFLKYNNPTSKNKGSLSLWNYDKIWKKELLTFKENINNNFNFLNIKRIEPFFNMFYRGNKTCVDYYFYLLFKNFNLKFLYKINYSKNLYSSINKFFDFNLINFYNLKNRLDSYKDVMAIKSVYQYRFANSSFKTMDEFMLTIFKTPLENYTFFNDTYKNSSYNILIDILIEIEKKNFLSNIYNYYDREVINYYNLYKFVNRLFKIYIYIFKFTPFIKLMKKEMGKNILKIDIFSRFYYMGKKKQLFYRIEKIKKRKFYRRKGSIKKLFSNLKYNSMFYVDINNISILFSGGIYELFFFSRSLSIVKMYNKFINMFNFYKNYKYLISLKDFYFQLIYENVEFFLITIFIFMNKIKNYNYYKFLNQKNIINYNFIYRKYTAYTGLDYRYYDDVFFNLKKFSKGNYCFKLNKGILRYFYEKSELHYFFSESIINNFKIKERIL